MSENSGTGLRQAVKAQVIRFRSREELREGALLVSAGLVSAALVLGGILAACSSLNGASTSAGGAPGITRMGGNTIPYVAPVPGSPAQQGSESHTIGSQSGHAGSESGEAQAGQGDLIPIVLQKDDTSGAPGTMTGKPDWPRFVPSDITITAGKQVTLMFISYDDANTPVESMMPFNSVEGGRETVDGTAVTSVGNSQIAHTFTVMELGINVPIPKAQHSRTGADTAIIPAEVTFTFTPESSGTFTWQCFTPCGTGLGGLDGPMVQSGYMRGILNID